jgi:hypothetical protein
VNGNSSFCNGNSFHEANSYGGGVLSLPYLFRVCLPIVVGPAGDAAQ